MPCALAHPVPSGRRRSAAIVCGVAVVPERDDSVRTAEVIAALCLATDLGMAFPFEHGLHRTLIAMRLADRLGVDRQTASETYYACLLSHAGCTTEAHIAAEVFGGSLTTNLNPVMYGSTREVVTGVLRALPILGAPRSSVSRRRPVGYRGWLVSSVPPSPQAARSLECWQNEWAPRPRCPSCSHS